MKKKDIKKANLLLYLGNPDNEFLSRNDMGVTILGYKHGQSIYRLFIPAELDEIENKAFEMRRKRTAAQRANGGDSAKAAWRVVTSETPPQAWGRRRLTILVELAGGNTPTGVGKTPA